MNSKKDPNIIAFQFSVYKEMIDQNGEDSYFAAVNDNKSIVSVFDGCGGLGAKEYANFAGKTGAYIASRSVCGATKAWFDQLIPPKIDTDEYSKYITKALEFVNSKADKNTFVLKGSMQKPFPTTAATAVVYYHKRTLYADFIWCGDSRGYMVDANGLHQITYDDIDGEDAMSNLKNDGVLTNVIYYNGNYKLHKKTIKLNTPAIVFCATDGCFGYLSTPMEFEHILLDTLLNSSSPDEWRSLLYSEFDKYAGDDYTLSLIATGYKNYNSLKKSVQKRASLLNHNYIAKINSATHDEKVQLWNKYKQNYEL